MVVLFTKGWNNKRIAQKPYPLSAKDRELVNETYNELHKQSRMEWVTKPTVFATLIFVIWRTVHGMKKGRVVADLRAVNRIAIPNNYPLPSQEKILNYFIGMKYITVLDIITCFYQYRIHPVYRYIFTVMSHRGLE